MDGRFVYIFYKWTTRGSEFENWKAGDELPSGRFVGSTWMLESELDIDHFDVIQGNVGDCWLLSAFQTRRERMS